MKHEYTTEYTTEYSKLSRNTSQITSIQVAFMHQSFEIPDPPPPRA